MLAFRNDIRRDCSFRLITLFRSLRTMPTVIWSWLDFPATTVSPTTTIRNLAGVFREVIFATALWLADCTSCPSDVAEDFLRARRSWKGSLAGGRSAPSPSCIQEHR